MFSYVGTVSQAVLVVVSQVVRWHLRTKLHMVGREDKRTNNRTMFPALKNNAAAGYKGPVKIELSEGEGLMLLYVDNAQ